MFAQFNVRIAVALAAQFARQHVVGEAAHQLAAVRCAEAHRVVERVFQRVAFVREARRNVENVARLHLFVDDGVERFHLQQIRMRAVLFQRRFSPTRQRRRPVP